MFSFSLMWKKSANLYSIIFLKIIIFKARFPANRIENILSKHNCKQWFYLGKYSDKYNVLYKIRNIYCYLVNNAILKI